MIDTEQERTRTGRKRVEKMAEIKEIKRQGAGGKEEMKGRRKRGNRDRKEVNIRKE